MNSFPLISHRVLVAAIGNASGSTAKSVEKTKTDI